MFVVDIGVMRQYKFEELSKFELELLLAAARSKAG